MESGATHVASAMAETANQLRQLAQLDPLPQPEADPRVPPVRVA
jgi:hypothetical protein